MSKLLITGGAGFIGCNAAEYFSNLGYEIIIVDNLSRPSAYKNLNWLTSHIKLKFEHCDIRDLNKVSSIFERYRPDITLHLAAQVAVTFSVSDPRNDFEINALGTFNVLECVRKICPNSIFINASTNKVYGKMSDLKIDEKEKRYVYTSIEGINEERAVDYFSPYGCSKGIADQYTIDYARIYGLRGVTLRQSCIYGKRQFGVEDQGWIAWFAIAVSLNKNITIYGNGKQVRDILLVDDLCKAYEACIQKIEAVAGHAINIGGGPSNSLSLLEYLNILNSKFQKDIKTEYSNWRPGDQEVYISNIAKAKEILHWEPKNTIDEGINRLLDWVKLNTNEFN